MPLSRAQKNPYQPGDIVYKTQFNGTGEGVLWMVKKVDKVWIWIEPVLTLTGRSVLRPKKLQYHQVCEPDLVLLCSVYAQLGNLINDVARRRGMEPGGGGPVHVGGKAERHVDSEKPYHLSSDEEDPRG